MFFRRGGALALALSAGLFVGLPAASAAPPLEAYARLPDISAMRLSPDGRHIAAVQVVNGRKQIVIYEFTAGGIKRFGFSVEDGIAQDVRWDGNDKLIAVYSKTFKRKMEEEAYAWTRAFSMSARGENVVRLMNDSLVGRYNRFTGGIADIALSDAGHIYIPASEFRIKGYVDTRLGSTTYVYNMYAVDVSNGHAAPSDLGNEYTIDWVMDGSGKAVGRIDQNANSFTNEIYVRPGGSGSWRKLTEYDVKGGSDMTVEGVTQDGGALAIAKYQNDKLSLYPLDMTSGATGPALFADPNYDVSNTLVDEWTGRVSGVAYYSDKEEYRYFDPARQKLQAALEAALPGQSVRIASADQAGQVFIIRNEGPGQPPTWQLFDKASGQLSFLASEYPDVTPETMGRIKPIAYKARDGRDIHGYLTLPPGKTDAKGLPLVVFPHGGPQARDSVSFDWWAQFMASRGYAVFQPNFRGSVGYGAKFRDAGFGQWGRAMQDDITDGVKKLIADGVADPARVCIVGASYGGYAALAGVTFTPELYKCAISYAGISNIAGQLGWYTRRHGKNNVAESELVTEIGDRYDPASIDAVSPYLHADQVRAPVLLMHSADDITVPVDQAVFEETALRSGSRPVEKVIIPSDDHYMENAATRTVILRETERFLTTYMGP